MPRYCCQIPMQAKTKNEQTSIGRCLKRSMISVNLESHLELLILHVFFLYALHEIAVFPPFELEVTLMRFIKYISTEIFSSRKLSSAPASLLLSKPNSLFAALNKYESDMLLTSVIISSVPSRTTFSSCCFICALRSFTLRSTACWKELGESRSSGYSRESRIIPTFLDEFGTARKISRWLKHRESNDSLWYKAHSPTAYFHNYLRRKSREYGL